MKAASIRWLGLFRNASDTHTHLLGYSPPKFALAKVTLGIWYYLAVVMYVLFCAACHAAQKPCISLDPQVSLLPTSITVAATI